MQNQYNNNYNDDSVYGRVINLVSKHGRNVGAHLDIGCGFGVIAEKITDLGLEYIGFDQDTSSIASIEARGYQAHEIDLCDIDSTISKIDLILAGRNVSSISIIDCLEHIKNWKEVLEKFWDFASNRSILLVIAVPNVAHRDIGLKLLAGKWDYTISGILDHTHVVHHTDKLLCRAAENAGWAEIDRNDWSMEISDQNFPSAHPLLSASTPIGSYLHDFRKNVDEFSTVNEFVRAYLPRGSKKETSILENHRFEPKKNFTPFLSIVTRTQGKRLGNLRDVLLCLTSQTCQEFELIIIAHKTEFEVTQRIKRLVEDCPVDFRSKCRVHFCDFGTRATPLNIGFGLATGEYVVALDDDDLVFAHWVSTFKELAEQSPGKVLRSVSAEQDIVSRGKGIDGILRFRTTSAIRTPYPSHYDFFAHLKQNFSPLMSLAFPRMAFSDMGIKFDETLNTAEDWDFEMRTVFLCGVTCSPEITAIYNKWQSGESSFHTQNEWTNDYDQIISKLNSKYRIFPPGTLKFIVDQQNWIKKLECDILELQTEIRGRQFKYSALRGFFNKHSNFRKLLRRLYLVMPNYIRIKLNKLRN